MGAITTPEDVLHFWFGDGTVRNEVWFGKYDAFDAEIRTRFGETIEAAQLGALDSWTSTPRGLLALVIVLDQFSRNAYRGTPRAFEQDAKAQRLVRMGLARGDDVHFTPVERGFLYLPFEHAEDLGAQEESVRLYAALHEQAPPNLREMSAEMLRYAVMHRDIIQRFQRFPHRNAILGRESTPEELEFLEQPNSSF